MSQIAAPSKCVRIELMFPPLATCSDDSDCGADEGCYNGFCMSAIVGEAKSAKGKIIDDKTAGCLVPHFYVFATSKFLVYK